jgi:hypothetical protein
MNVYAKRNKQNTGFHQTKQEIGMPLREQMQANIDIIMHFATAESH